MSPPFMPGDVVRCIIPTVSQRSAFGIVERVFRHRINNKWAIKLVGDGREDGEGWWACYYELVTSASKVAQIIRELMP